MKVKYIFLLFGIFLNSSIVRANYVSFPDGFAADGDCYSGCVNFTRNVLLFEPKPLSVKTV